MNSIINSDDFITTNMDYEEDDTESTIVLHPLKDYDKAYNKSLISYFKYLKTVYISIKYCIRGFEIVYKFSENKDIPYIYKKVDELYVKILYENLNQIYYFYPVQFVITNIKSFIYKRAFNYILKALPYYIKVISKLQNLNNKDIKSLDRSINKTIKDSDNLDNLLDSLQSNPEFNKSIDKLLNDIKSKEFTEKLINIETIIINDKEKDL
jgi:hypothetical protein